MQKLTFVFVLLFSGLFLVACSGGDKKADPAPADEPEAIISVERFWQLNNLDENVPQADKLHCKYTVIETVEDAKKMTEAEIKTNGQCQWDNLKKKAGDPNTDVPSGNLEAMAKVIAGIEFPEDKDPKWDCAAMHVTTNKRDFWAYDCNLRDREKVRTDNAFAMPQDAAPSGSPEEAAFRLNSLF